MFKLREMFMNKVSGERGGQGLEFWERNVIPAPSEAASQLLHGHIVHFNKCFQLVKLDCRQVGQFRTQTLLPQRHADAG